MLKYFDTSNFFLFFLSSPGNFEDGKKYHLESLKRRLDLLKTEKHPHIGACYNNLGLLYENMGEYDKALEYYEKGLKVKVDTKAPVASRLISVCNVAMQYMQQGNLEKAYNLLVDAENELKTHGQASTFIESFIKDCLAQVLIEQGKYHEALGVIYSAILIRRIATPNNLTLTESLYHRANAYRGLKNYKSAKTVLNRALKTSDPCIKQMPRTMIMLKCYKMMMDISIDECNSDEAAGFYVKSKQELIRILGLYQKYGCPKIEKQLQEQLINIEQKWIDFSSASKYAAGRNDDDDLIEKEKMSAKQKMLDQDFEATIPDSPPQHRPELRVNTQRRASIGSGQNLPVSTPQSAQSPIYRLSYTGTPPVDERQYFPQHRPPLLSSLSNEIITEEDSEHKGGPAQNKNTITSSSSSSANQINNLSGIPTNPEPTISSNCDNNNLQNNVNLLTTEMANLDKKSSVKDYTNSKNLELSKFGINSKNSLNAESKDTNKLNNTKVNISESLNTAHSIDENDAYTFSISPNSEKDVPKTFLGCEDNPNDPNETIPKRYISSGQSSFDKTSETEVKEKNQEDVSKTDRKKTSLEDPNTESYWNTELKSLLAVADPKKEDLNDQSGKPESCNKKNGIFQSLSSTVSKFFSLPVSMSNPSDHRNEDKEDGNNDDNTSATFSPFSI